MDITTEKHAAIQASARKAALAFLTHRIPHPVGSPERAVYEQAFAGQVLHVVGLPGGELVTGTVEEAGHGFEPGAILKVAEDGTLVRVPEPSADVTTPADLSSDVTASDSTQDSNPDTEFAG